MTNDALAKLLARKGIPHHEIDAIFSLHVTRLQELEAGIAELSEQARLLRKKQDGEEDDEAWWAIGYELDANFRQRCVLGREQLQIQCGQRESLMDLYGRHRTSYRL